MRIRTIGKDRAASRASRGRRLLGGALRFGLFATLALLFVYAFALPKIAESVLQRRLRAAGLDGWSLHVRSISWHALELADLRSAVEGRLRAECLRVDFEPLELGRSHVAGVEVIGARWEVRWEDGNLDLGLPAWTSSEEGRPLRIDRIDVKASTLVLRTAGGTWHVPVDGSVQREASGEHLVELDLRLPIALLHVRASVPALGEAGPFELEVSPAPLDGAPGALRGTLENGAVARGRATEAGSPAEAWAIEIGAALDRLDLDGFGRRLTATAVALELQAEATPQAGVTGLESSLVADTLALDGVEAESLELRMDYAPESSRVVAAARGEHWQLEAASLEVAGDVLEPQGDRQRVEARGSVLLDPAVLAGTGAAASGAPQLSVASVVSIPPLRSAAPLEARIESLRIDLLPFELVPTATGVPAVRTTASLLLAGTVGREGVELTVLPGTRLDLTEDVDRPAARVGLLARAESEDERAPAGAIAFVPSDPRSTLAITLPHLALSAEGLSLSTPISIDEVGLELPLSFAVDEERVVLGLREAGLFRGAAIQDADGAPTWRAGGWEVALQGNAEMRAPLAGDAPPEMRGALAVALAAPVDVEAAALQARLTELRLSADLGVEWSPFSAPDVRARVELPRVLDTENDLLLEDVLLDTPLPRLAGPPSRADASPADEGLLEIGAVSLRGIRLPGSSAVIRRNGAGLDLAGVWPLGPSLTLEIQGNASSDLRSAALDLNGQGAIRPEEPLGLLIADLAPFHLEADVELASRTLLEQGSLWGGARLAARNGRIESADGARALEEVEATTAWEWRDTLRSSGEQEVLWKAGRVGDLELGPGRVRFAVEDPSNLLVQSVDCVTAGGSRFWVQGFRIDRATTSAELQVFCQDVSLAECLAFTTSGRAEGEGRLNGRLALGIRPGQRPAFTLGDGYLASLGEGRIRLQDAEALRAMLAQGMGDVSVGQDTDLTGIIGDRIVGSLRDFRYRSLVFRLVPEDDDLTLQAIVIGEGVQVPQELNWTVNFRGFGALLELLLELELGSHELR